jgi:hypothetical protein
VHMHVHVHVGAESRHAESLRTDLSAPIYGDMGPWLQTLLSRGQAESPK